MNAGQGAYASRTGWAAANARRAGLLGGTLLAAGLLLHAGEGHGAEWQLQALSARYDAREATAAGVELNRDRGTLVGASAGIAADAWGMHWTLSAARLGAAVAYTGFNQIGLPLRTQTDLRLQRIDLVAEPAARLAIGRGSLGGVAGLGGSRIDRAIRASLNSLPATEVMCGVRLSLGLSWDQPLADAVTLRLDATADWPLRQRLLVTTFGQYEDYSLRPASRAGTTFRLALRWRVTPAATLRFEFDDQRLPFGASDAVVVTRDGRPSAVSSYPGSRQRLETLRIGAGMTF